jgi:hypothetical protein
MANRTTKNRRQHTSTIERSQFLYGEIGNFVIVELVPIFVVFVDGKSWRGSRVSAGGRLSAMEHTLFDEADVMPCVCGGSFVCYDC